MAMRRGTLILGVTLLVAAGCQDPIAPPLEESATPLAALRGPPGGGPLTLTLSPAVAGLTIGATVQLANAVTNPAGRAVNTRRPVAWTTSDAAVAAVSATGLVTAIGPGSATITAAFSNGSGTAEILVCPPGTIPLNTTGGIICFGSGSTPAE